MSRKKITFTKTCVRWILIISLLDLQLSYLLAFLGRENIAETLSITVCTEVISVMAGYFMKSYFETKQEKKQKLEDQKFQDESLNHDFQIINLDSEEDYYG